MLMLIAIFAIESTVFAQGVTTAAISGVVEDNDGNGLEGATVIAIHNPTGTKYGVISRAGGRFNLPNVRVGGPYTITSSYVGYSNAKQDGLYLSLGQKRNVTLTLANEGVVLEEVVISTTTGILGSKKTGAETSIGERQINQLPTVSRDLIDFARLTPQATLTEDGDGELGLSVAGQNNRFNSVFIDGAISNDVFGLTDQGTNGGQAGISPISVDAIEQFNIVVAPYDVTIGGFTGAGVNAVTRSGSNDVEASAYFLFRNQGLAGKTPTDDPDRERTKLADFSSQTTGFRVGGPIVKDKIFFFVNAEIERRETPQPFDFADYDGASSLSDVQGLASTLQERYGYDPGTFLDNVRTVKAEKFLAKLDFNLGDNSNLSIRHSYSKGRAEKVNPSNNQNINFSNSYEFFPSTTNSTALELNSVIGESMANSLIVGYTRVRDDRDELGDPFPRVRISDGDGAINFGTEPFSTANNLEQDILTLTDNFNIYSGNHSITIGTHNEFYSVLNLFVRQNFGDYDYRSLSDFLNDEQPSDYDRSYTIRQEDGIDGAVGDEIVGAAAAFKGLQLGFYIQDEIAITTNFTLTAGLRLDIPMFLDDPAEDIYFNNTTVGLISEYYDLEGARAGQLPSTQLLLSPRVGFSLDVAGDEATIIRGGLGLFTSRLPLVWAGGSFTNNGLNVGGVFNADTLANGNPMTFRPDPADQYTQADFGGTDVVPSGQMDIFTEDLKFPQIFRGSIAVDQKLPWGMVGSLEFIYTKTLNSIYYKNVNLKPAVDQLDGVDNRDYFDDRDPIDGTYGRIMWGANTNKGYTYNFTASLTKPFDNGLTASLSYTYGDARAISDLTSSQNSSQWRDFETVGGKNDIEEVGPFRSDFSVGSRIVGSLAYRLEYANALATTVSLFFNGQSGEVFSYTYTGGQADALTNQDSRDYTDLIFVPASQDQIVFADEATAAQQWADLDAFIEQDSYLSTRRGEYAERNGARTPFIGILDLRILQDFFVKAGGKRHNLQLSLDIFNFTNMLNPNWGRRYRSVFNGVGLIGFEGFDADATTGPLTPTFSFTAPKEADGTISSQAALNIDDTGTLSSRWQGQIGIRYIFD